MAADEDRSYTSLAMDRSLPLGNSIDTFNRRALHVKIGNFASEPIPIIADSGEDFFLSAETTTTPGIEQDLITYTVPAGKRVVLYNTYVSCRYEGRFSIHESTNLVGSGRTGPACINGVFPFGPSRRFESGNVLVLKFKAEAFRPSASIDAFIQGRIITL